jgi:putative hemolysin
MKRLVTALAIALSISACKSREPDNYIVVPEGSVDYYYGSYNDSQVEHPTNIPQAIERSVVVREKGPYYISYEYRDVRIDDVAKIADEYCEKQGLRAYLRESLTHRNNNRISTFDCIIYK